MKLTLRLVVSRLCYIMVQQVWIPTLSYIQQVQPNQFAPKQLLALHMLALYTCYKKLSIIYSGLQSRPKEKGRLNLLPTINRRRNKKVRSRKSLEK